MANKTIFMIKLRQIFRLHAQDKNKRQIAAQTGVSRNTVEKYISDFIVLRLTCDDVSAMSDHQIEDLFGHAEVPKTDVRFENVKAFFLTLKRD